MQHYSCTHKQLSHVTHLDKIMLKATTAQQTTLTGLLVDHHSAREQLQDKSCMEDLYTSSFHNTYTLFCVTSSLFGYN